MQPAVSLPLCYICAFAPAVAYSSSSPSSFSSSSSHASMITPGACAAAAIMLWSTPLMIYTSGSYSSVRSMSSAGSSEGSSDGISPQVANQPPVCLTPTNTSRPECDHAVVLVEKVDALVLGDERGPVLRLLVRCHTLVGFLDAGGCRAMVWISVNLDCDEIRNSQPSLWPSAYSSALRPSTPFSFDFRFGEISVELLRQAHRKQQSRKKHITQVLVK